MPERSLDAPVDVETVRALHKAGVLNDAAQRIALAQIRPPRVWWTWANRILLLVGCSLLLAGIIFFFAYNWSQMHRFFKLGLVEAGIVISVLGAFRWGGGQLTGKLFLMSASVLTGVLLAVHGQIYQTGADAYELFFIWSLLIAGWVAISDFGGLWITWLLVFNTGLYLYWDQVGQRSYDIRYETLCLAMGITFGLALLAREVGMLKQFRWLKEPWLRMVLLSALLLVLTVPALGLIVEPREGEAVSVALLFIWILTGSTVSIVYRRFLPDIKALSVTALSYAVVLLTLIGKLLSELFDGSEEPLALFLGIAILIVISLTVTLLRHVHTAMQEATNDR